MLQHDRARPDLIAPLSLNLSSMFATSLSISACDFLAVVPSFIAFVISRRFWASFDKN